jgi:hypothetical protein
MELHDTGSPLHLNSKAYVVLALFEPKPNLPSMCMYNDN